MAELKREARVSSQLMEAAMVARLFKDALLSKEPIVAHFVWTRDDGQSLDMGLPKAHPNFQNLESVEKRLEDRIAMWVSGEKPSPDRNAVLRLEADGVAQFDFSMESFEKSALADDGSLVIGVGLSKMAGREPMLIGRTARLKLYGADGKAVGRQQALLPIKDIIHIQKRERETQAARLGSPARQLENAIDTGQALAKEENRQWADFSQDNAPAEGALVGAPVANDPARKLMDNVIHAVEKNMGQALKTTPLLETAPLKENSKLKHPVYLNEFAVRAAADREAAAKAAKDEADREAAAKAAKDEADREAAAKGQADREAAAKGPADRKAAAKDWADRKAAAKAAKDEADRKAAAKAAKDEADREAAAKAAKDEADREAAAKARSDWDAAAKERADREAAAKERADREAAAKERTDREAAAKDQADREAAAKERADREAAAKDQADREAAAKDQADREAAAKELASASKRSASKESMSAVSQIKLLQAASRIEPLFIRAVFPLLPEGVDEIFLSIEKIRLFEALEALEFIGGFELRLASKSETHLSLGICVPAGQVAILADFISTFSHTGIMIKRVPGPSRNTAKDGPGSETARSKD